MALLQQDHQLLEEPPHPISGRRLTVDGDLVAPDMDLDIGERALDQPQQLVALTEQAGHEVVAGNGDLDLSRTHRESVSERTLGTWINPAA